MPADLNKLAEQLRSQKTLAVTRSGQLVEYQEFDNPDQNVNVDRFQVCTTLEPTRFGC